ncbi:MAG TPA: hypothetical protein VG125_30870 [Pirellulales bacterium]|jgi:hypothetical protein|nr:hypothetical protein [Pirellulales bacterium]
MNVTREVIHDLWPVYASGEASADTRALVQEFLRQDPDLAALLREEEDQGLLRQEVPKLSPDREGQALSKTKRQLRGPVWLFFLAMMFSCFAFGRIISDTSWDVSPVNFIVTAAIAGLFWSAFFTRLFWIRHFVYRPKR